jgi:diaminohydroxyphosphoribosylaminopyrimidine deaminase / 5-amino-6-(5-phosphoribosylamino)uracil reductase
MQRALDLASLGLGSVSPNPLVGAVVVYEGKVIGEGWHKKFGEPHAEVEAINSVQQPELLSESALYVTLEPCSHHGKTPPCADFIISKKIKKVVVAMTDPNPLVAGRGIEKLRQAGVEVEIGLLEDEARTLNKRFLTYFEKNRPYVILKWAQTSDGFIAPSLQARKEGKQISNSLSQQLVHKWRSVEDAIMLGMNTLVHDNPQLNVRLWETSKQPLRVTLDEKGAFSGNYHFFDGTQNSIVFNYLKEENGDGIKYAKLNREKNSIEQILSRLRKEGVGSILVEGGTKLLEKFLEANLWDEARVCTSPKTFGKGIAAPFFQKQIREKFFIKEDRWQISLNRPAGNGA